MKKKKATAKDKMRLIVKDMDIATGSVLVAIINQEDARKLDLHVLDRIKIFKGINVETVVVDIAESEKAVAVGHIGVFEEVIDSLRLKHGDAVEIVPAKKPLSLEYIKKKLDGKTLTKNELNQIVWDIVHNKLNDVELTYFVAACYMGTLNTYETTVLTQAMTRYGDRLRVNLYPVMDKHSIGGVPANRTTMAIVPIVAAAGLTIPKTSSRSITSPAGTADTMEVLAPVDIPLSRMKKIVQRHRGCIVWGGALNLAPADDKIIKVERPLGIDAKSQLLASVMAKKASVGATHLLIDIPVGKETKAKSRKEALGLKREFEILAKALHIQTRVIITDGRQPIGNGIGPGLEARDVLWILQNDPKGPLDLKKKSLKMAGYLLELGGKAKRGQGIKAATEILESGKAYKKMVEIVKAQGGHITKANKIPLGRYRFTYCAPKTGYVRRMDNTAISKLARVAGAPQNKGSGVYMHVHLGYKVRKNQPLLTIYAESRHKLEYVKEVLRELDGIEVG